jgi:hypothetical protein
MVVAYYCSPIFRMRYIFRGLERSGIWSLQTLSLSTANRCVDSYVSVIFSTKCERISHISLWRHKGGLHGVLRIRYIIRTCVGKLSPIVLVEFPANLLQWLLEGKQHATSRQSVEYGDLNESRREILPEDSSKSSILVRMVIDESAFRLIQYTMLRLQGGNVLRLERWIGIPGNKDGSHINDFSASPH